MKISDSCALEGLLSQIRFSINGYDSSLAEGLTCQNGPPRMKNGLPRMGCTRAGVPQKWIEDGLRPPKTNGLQMDRSHNGHLDCPRGAMAPQVGAPRFRV